MSEAAEFIDAALQYEASPYSYSMSETDGLERYGTSIGAIRGTIRDALKRYRGMTHDDITALSSELWAVPVFERRQSAIVLLQTRVGDLVANDLTRIEGFIRTAGAAALIDQLLADVLHPLFAAMDEHARARGEAVLRRWARDEDPALGAAARRLGQL